MITANIPFDQAVRSRGVGAHGLAQSEWLSNGKYPVIGQGSEFIEGHTNRSDLLIVPTPSVILYGGHTRRAKYVNFAFVPGPNIKILEAKDKTTLDHKYLFFFLSQLKIESRGYADHFPQVKRSSIPLQGIEDQIRIAQLLGKMEGLIAERKHHLQQLDALLKSVFLEMFGDPVRNEKGWDKYPLSVLLNDIESGKSPKCEARPAAPDEWGVLKLGAVTRCTFDASENKALPADVPPSTRDEVKPGDLLFSRKNTYDLVAACAYVFETRPRLLMPDLIFRLVFKKAAEVNPIYMWKLLTNASQRKAIQSLAAGAAGSMPNISKSNLKTVRLPMPPALLQNEFAGIVEKVELLKFRYQQSLADLETLYAALSQKAFKGELDLSRVPLPGAVAASSQLAPRARATSHAAPMNQAAAVPIS